MPGQRVNSGLIVREEEASSCLLLVGPQVKQFELTPHVGGHNLRRPREDDISD
jgi:hypothetical protein